ncbi:ergothioneine biosynthesis protein EgtC [Vulgatibacter sp.]|uniref:ergothioneine biosynthesis protein EgtC n=1 Tax=Vulgatibacter sp. TaxID=1971226 RepID=UPI00356AC650
MLATMCRLLGYLGEEAPLGALVSAPPHSLVRQSWQARELVSATVNADGWGAGLYVPGDPDPCLYTSTLPIWADANVPHLGRALRSRCLVAAVRSATDPLTVAHANTQPFAAGRLVFLHNGFVEGFRTSVRRRLCAALSDERFAGIAGTTDSEHLFALVLEELDQRGGAGDPAVLLEATAAAVARVAAWAKEAGAKAHFAVVVADGTSLVALRTATEPEPPSLYLHPGGGAIAAGTIVASERLDDDERWRRIEPGQGVIATLGGEAAVVELR